MVRIRFRRVGLKKQPSYRIVVIDQRKARNGRFIEVIGHHNPRTEPSTDVIDEARALYWLSVGAQPSDSVRRLMVRTGTWERYERLRGGEPVETLVEEAEAAYEAAEPVSPRTRYPSPAPGQGRTAGATAAAVAAEAVAEAEAVEEAEEEVEDEAEEAAAAEVEEETKAEAAEVAEEVEEPAEAEVEEEAEAETDEAEPDEAAEDTGGAEEAEADEEEDETE